MFALVFRNRVVQVSEETFDVHPNYKWIECDETVEVGYSYSHDDHSFFDESVHPSRIHRNNKLKESDWVVMPDSPIKDGDLQEWMDYRQALRDVPQQSGFPDEVDWPIKPK
jgi:hypothetical protein